MKAQTKKVLGAAAGAAATGAALAGAYYYYGSDKAAAHRRELKSWAKKAEKEIVHSARKVKDQALSDTYVRALITEAARRYQLTKDLDEQDVRDFIGAMQRRWQEVRKAFADDAKGARKKASKAVKGKQRRPRTKKTSN